jgi:hypothetical protein
MYEVDRREYPRVQTRNLISYFSVDKEGNKLTQGMGRALDISQSGILLETARRIESEHMLLVFVDLENNLATIKGKIAYCKNSEPKKFRTGISFRGTDEENIEIVKKLLKLYHTRKNGPVNGYKSESIRRTLLRF